MQFRASYDTATKVISASIFVVFLFVAAETRNVIAEGVLAFLFLAAYAWSPTSYSIMDGEVVIRRLVGSVHLPIAGIREVRIAAADDLNGSMRVFGSGGLFGYYGLFRNSKLGTCRWYVTNRSQAVVLVGDSETAIVSPDNTAGFIAAIGKPATASLPSDRGGHGLGWIRVACLVAGAGILGAVFLYAPGPEAYTLTKDSLVIHDRFFPVTLNAASVDVGAVRVIDFDRDKDKDWKPVLRTGGIGSLHYHAGWFRVSSGRTVRMYRADSSRVVLLPPKGNGTAVLFEAKEPDQLVAELRREWGDEQSSTTGN